MIDFSKIKKLTVDGVDLKSLAINEVQVWKSGPKNWVPYSTEADGVTIYNGGLGYKDGYRVRSSGAEAASTDHACTGFIPFKVGDVLRIYSPNETAFVKNSFINVSDAGHTNIGQLATNGVYGIFNVSGYSWDKFVTTDANGVRTFFVPSTLDGADDIAFVRVTIGFQTGVSGDGMIITVNEEIT